MNLENYLQKFLAEAGIQLNGNRPFDIRIKDRRVFKKWAKDPSLAIGEAYMAGWWECDRLDELFFKIFRHYQHSSYYPKWSLFIQYFKNLLVNLQTKVRSKEVAEIHYDLGNDLYSLMLGPSMAYTCAYWQKAEHLDQAQINKFDLVCRKLNLKPGEQVLELGCGWGSFAKYAAENYGCKVVGVNISQEQVRFAKDACRHLPIEIYLCDYRDSHVYNPQNKQFDKVVSIGLCEHVGIKNYHTFMQIAKQQLKESGLFVLHTIGKDVTDYYIDPWINKYIFPNGMLPSLALLTKAMENVFILEDLHNFGADYDKTLMAWHQNFNDNWPKLKDKYDEAFFRGWNYYLLSCAGGFRARSMRLWQMVLSPNGCLGGYQSVR